MRSLPATALLVIVACSSQAGMQNAKIQLSTVETAMGDLVVRNSEEHPAGPVYSSDGKHQAYEAVQGGKRVVILDGVAQEPCDGISYLSASREGGHIVWVARRGGIERVVLDGKEQRDYGSCSMPVFSPDGKRLAYTAERGGKHFIVLDGKEGKPTDYIRGGPTFSPDSRRFAFHSSPGHPNLTKQFATVDGVPGKTYDGIESLLMFSPDSRRFAYIARKGLKKCLVVDGKEGKLYTDILDDSVKFSPDGKHVSYTAGHVDLLFDTHDAFVVLDGVEGNPMEIVNGRPILVAFSPDSKRVAYVSPCGEEQRIVLDKAYANKCYTFVQQLTFSPDSKHFAYKGMELLEGKSVVVLDGNEVGEYAYGRVGDFVFSADSKHFAYVGQQLTGKKWVVVLDGKEIGTYDMVGPLVFSQEGGHLAYVATTEGKDFVVVDGVEGRNYPKVYDFSLAFSSDGGHFCYIACATAPGSPRSTLAVMDGVEGKLYDSFATGLVFEGSNAVNAIASRDGKALRVHMDIN